MNSEKGLTLGRLIGFLVVIGLVFFGVRVVKNHLVQKQIMLLKSGEPKSTALPERKGTASQPVPVTDGTKILADAEFFDPAFAKKFMDLQVLFDGSTPVNQVSAPVPDPKPSLSAIRQKYGNSERKEDLKGVAISPPGGPRADLIINWYQSVGFAIPTVEAAKTFWGGDAAGKVVWLVLKPRPHASNTGK